MAKKKTKKTRTSRRRRVGAIDKAGLQQAAMVTAGFVAGQLALNVIDKMDKNGKLSKPIKGAILIAAGQFLLPKVTKGSAIGKAIGLGMAVRGGASLLSMLNIAGLGNVQYVPMIAGPGEGISATVAGTGIRQTVGGMSTRNVAAYS